MDVQEIVVGIIVVCSLGFILHRILRIIKRIRRNDMPSCGCGCTHCPSSGNCLNEKKNSDFIEKNPEMLADSKNSRTFATAIEKQR